MKSFAWLKDEPYLQWPEMLEPLFYVVIAIALCL